MLVGGVTTTEDMRQEDMRIEYAHSSETSLKNGFDSDDDPDMKDYTALITASRKAEPLLA